MGTLIKKISNSEIEITEEIPAERFSSYYREAVKELGKELRIKGFRKGHIPPEIIEKEIGQTRILNYAAQNAISDYYIKAVKENSLDVIERPKIEILKLAPSDSLIFRAKVKILPEIELPDYKKIASSFQEEKIVVGEEEVQQTIDWLRRSRSKLIALGREAKKGDFVEIEYWSSQIEGGRKMKDGFILGKGGFIPGFEEKIEGMKAGQETEECMKDWPDVFPEIFWNMIRIGEESGNLEEVLHNLSRQMEKTYELREKVKGALIYPAVIIVAMAGIGVLMLVMVVPKLAQTFEELGIELPLTTRLVIYSAQFISHFWYIFLAVLVVIGFLLRQTLKTEKGSKFFDKIMLKIPIVSSIIKGTNTAYTARTLSSLINAGVPIVKSLEIISRTLTNYYFREAISASAKEVRKGTKLSEALRPYSKIYPYSFAEMIAVGEETGETADVLEKLAEFSEAEVENLTRNLASAIEPVIMIFIGIAVGFFAVSMIQPMYSMLQSL